MVSVYPNPPPDRDFMHFYGFHMGVDPMNIPGLNRVENSLLRTSPVGNAGSGMDDPNKRIRKPYTNTKSRESWSEQEHDKFIEALQLQFWMYALKLLQLWMKMVLLAGLIRQMEFDYLCKPRFMMLPIVFFFTL